MGQVAAQRNPRTDVLLDLRVDVAQALRGFDAQREPRNSAPSPLLGEGRDPAPTMTRPLLTWWMILKALKILRRSSGQKSDPNSTSRSKNPSRAHVLGIKLRVEFMPTRVAFPPALSQQEGQPHQRGLPGLSRAFAQVARLAPEFQVPTGIRTSLADGDDVEVEVSSLARATVHASSAVAAQTSWRTHYGHRLSLPRRNDGAWASFRDVRDTSKER